MRAPRSILILMLLFVTLGLGVPQAQAHDRLISTTPSSGASVSTVSEVRLTFSAKVLNTGARVQVTSPDGSDAATGKPTIDGAVVTQPVRATGGGTFKVTWRVTSSDGHPIAGDFSFTSTAAAKPTNSAGAPSSTSTPAIGGDTASASTAPSSATSATPSTSPSTSIGTDETSNAPWVIAGLGVVALIVVAAGALFTRKRLRDDD